MSLKIECSNKSISIYGMYHTTMKSKIKALMETARLRRIKLKAIDFRIKFRFMADNAQQNPLLKMTLLNYFILFAVAFFLTTKNTAAQNHDPSAMQTIFVASDYHLSAKIPSGLFVCNASPSSVSGNHGIIVYLTRPKACKYDAPEAISQSDNSPISKIDIWYAYNVAEIHFSDGRSGTPANNRQLAIANCDKPYRDIPKNLILFGQPAYGCMTIKNDKVIVLENALYTQPYNVKNANDSELVLSLTTTKKRFNQDIENFEKISRSFVVTPLNETDR
jgi:hypothetical protein